MTTQDILTRRLSNQLLTKTTFSKPADIVSWFGAVQSQDYASAKWAIMQRTLGATDQAIEQAFTDGKILRTHVMRPTWHFVHPSDIRWILALTAPRVKAVIASYNRTLELDDAFFAKSNTAIAKALEGKYLTRPELGEHLKQAGLDPKSLFRLGFIVSRAELDGVICSGPRRGPASPRTPSRGGQFTYALLEERAPQTKKFTHDEALAELTKRYFTSHGPAQIQDFVWWSGLTTVDAKAGIAMNKSSLVSETIDGKDYWFSSATPLPMSKTAYLLPNYDEYTIAYKDRSAFYALEPTKKQGSREDVPFNHTIIMNGRIIGMWKRTLKKDTVVIDSRFFNKLSEPEHQAFIKAASRYGKFLTVPVVLNN